MAVSVSPRIGNPKKNTTLFQIFLLISDVFGRRRRRRKILK